MSGRKSQRKGADFERHVVNLFKSWGWPADRESAILERLGKRTGVDVTVRLPQLDITVQCKVGKRPNIWNAVKEVTEGSMAYQYPVAVVKKNGAGGRPAETIVAMDTKTFRSLVHGLDNALAGARQVAAAEAAG